MSARTAGDRIPRIGKRFAEQGVHTRAGQGVGAAVLGQRRQGDGPGSHPGGRIVHRLDRDREAACGLQGAAAVVDVARGAGVGVEAVGLRRQARQTRAGVAGVAVGHGDGQDTVEVGGVGRAFGVGPGQRQCAQALVEFDLGGAADREAGAAEATDVAANAAQGHDGARAQRDRGRQRGGAMVVGVVDGERALSGVQPQRGRALGHAHRCGGDASGVVVGHDGQGSRMGRDVVDAERCCGAGVGVQAVAERHRLQPGLVGHAAVGAAGEHASSVAQAVVDHDLHTVGGREIHAVGAAHSQFQSVQEGLELRERAAHRQRPAGAVERCIDDGAVRRGR